MGESDYGPQPPRGTQGLCSDLRVLGRVSSEEPQHPKSNHGMLLKLVKPELMRAYEIEDRILKGEMAP